jgi:hypothetical protein
MPDYVTVRIWKDTRRLLRLIAAQTDEQMVEVMHRLCERECERLGMSLREIANELANKPQTANKKGKPL